MILPRNKHELAELQEKTIIFEARFHTIADIVRYLDEEIDSKDGYARLQVRMARLRRAIAKEEGGTDAE